MQRAGKKLKKRKRKEGGKKIRTKKQKKQKKKKCSSKLCLLSVCFAAAGVTPAFAAPVQAIYLHLRLEEFDAMGMPVFEADSSDSSYVVMGITSLREEEATGPAAELRETKEAVQSASLYSYEVELSAETEEGFSVLTQDQIHISGEKAVCVKAVRSDQRQTLRLTLELTEPKEVIGEIEQVRLENGTAYWSAAPGATAYYVMLYRNGKRLRDGHRTEGCRFDFSALMTEEGCYFCRVFPLTEKGKKGILAESGRLFLDALQAEQLQKQWKLYLEENFELCSLNDSGWILSAGDWYYKNRDGTFAVSTHLELEGKRYYFDEEGKWTGEAFPLSSDSSKGS